ncbi:hypothetical protein [Streptomyces sp. CB02959]|uniref:hypothetical protein n=1 Tax=Streptomyces sp. CB02959 TaxID=2020330 RepID=UPI0021526F14|nr:hypothetical protein [Streptomyces sp. CB02959]
MILYIAFALVALWLLGEVLFQHKAPVRWRLLALCGFLCVVAGVLIPSVIVIALGAIAFAIGQTFVTLSVRRGYEEGWTIGGRPKPNRRRRARSSRAPAAGPNLQVSGLTEETAPAAADAAAETPPGGHGGYGGHGEDGGHGGYGGHGEDGGHGGDGAGSPDPYQPLPDAPGPGEPPAAAPDFFEYGQPDAATVYAPQPLPDETGAYGVYSPDARPDPLAAPASYDVFGNATADGDGNGQGYGGGYAPTTGQDGYADPYPAYDQGAYHGGQAPYSDPYIGTQQYAAHYDPYEEPDPFGQGQYQTGQYYDGLGGQPAQHYGQEYHPETPPDGVWVPQQRETGHPAEQPTYPPPQHPGYDEQRYHY